jgi:ubiquinone/menaquinone biosynthesis C-methylase UbiE
MIDVRTLIQQYSIEELNAAAEQYFVRIIDPTYLLSKPFAEAEECSRILISFAALLQGLSVVRTMTVLDLGAGSCWTSYLLTQMGLKVHAVDVSRTALELGRKRFTEHPPFGNQPDPEFHIYDGHRLPMPDGSVDRVFCFDAFHHLPNPEAIIREIARVLKPEGIAGFSEPGPNHSRTPEAQMEMEGHRVIENDIVAEDIFKWAKAAGFKRMELTAMPHTPPRVSLEEYNAFLKGPSPVDERVLALTREFANIARIFFLWKSVSDSSTSLSKKHLSGKLEVSIPGGPQLRQQETIRAVAKVRNDGQAIWLPASARAGAVYLGCHLTDISTGLRRTDYCRAPLTPSPGTPIHPGQMVQVDLIGPGLPPGRYEIEFDLVSEWVCWFAQIGGQTPRFRIEVLA